MQTKSKHFTAIAFRAVAVERIEVKFVGDIEVLHRIDNPNEIEMAKPKIVMQLWVDCRQLCLGRSLFIDFRIYLATNSPAQCIWLLEMMEIACICEYSPKVFRFHGRIGFSQNAKLHRCSAHCAMHSSLVYLVALHSLSVWLPATTLEFACLPIASVAVCERVSYFGFLQNVLPSRTHILPSTPIKYAARIPNPIGMCNSYR